MTNMASHSQPVLAETAIGEAASSAAHTPGPWSACGQDRGGCSCGQVWSRAVDQPVAKANTIWGDDLEHPYGEIPFAEMVANARLIAAAPELLAAATCALGMLTGNLDGDWSLGDPVDMLRAAIAKASPTPPAPHSDGER